MARGRILQAPPGQGTRPTSDRVREAVFSILTSMDLIEGAAVLDLFAGSGALGIEALSRGAEGVVFVESDAVAVGTIRTNLSVLGELAGRATVVQGDVSAYLKRGTAFDLVLADPPYRFEGWAAVLDSLLGTKATLVTETGSLWDPGPSWETVKVKKYGGTVVMVIRPAVVADDVGVTREGES